MREISVQEASDKLGHLIDLVERGEEVMILRNGKEVARLVPARRSATREAARAAAHRLRERAQRLRLGAFDWQEWKTYRDEGRR